MTDNVIHLAPDTVGENAVIDADKILEANKGEFSALVLVGEREDGSIAVAGTHGAGDSVILLQWAINYLVEHKTVRAP